MRTGGQCAVRKFVNPVHFHKKMFAQHKNCTAKQICVVPISKLCVKLIILYKVKVHINKTKNMLRPSNKEFVEWTISDSNVSRIRNALSTFPDLVKIKDHVSSNVAIFFCITFTDC